MQFRKCLIAAAVAAMTCGSLALASEPSSGTSSSDAVYLDGTPTTLTPAMYLLDKTSFGKWLEAENISIGGFGEFGYFYDTSNPRYGSNTPGLPGNGDAPTLIGFPGDYSNRGLLDQVDMMFQKTVDTTKNFDFGFQFEQGYGIDDALIHGYGITDNRAPGTIDNKFQFGRTGESYADGEPEPNDQYDIVQGNVSVEAYGATVKAGKFVTLLGYESINPTLNPFYTHSYLFTFGLPLTQTGVLGSYTINKLINGNNLTVTGGVTRGWNEATSDNNGEVDFLGEMQASITSALSMTFVASEGPESYAAPLSSINGTAFSAANGDFKGDSHNYWTVLELEPSYTVSDQLTVAADILYADFPHGALTDVNAAGTPAGNAAQWYAVCAYTNYKICSYAALNTRLEWYRDQGGFTVGAASGPVSANYYEGTVGVDIHPMPNDDILQWLQLRPEVRYDWSDRPVYNATHSSALGGTGDYSEFTCAMDVIMQY